MHQAPQRPADPPQLSVLAYGAAAPAARCATGRAGRHAIWPGAIARAAGGPWARAPWPGARSRAQASFATEAVALARHASSPGVERGHCAACGTSLTYANDGRPDEIDVTLATLDDPTALRPACHLWVGERLAFTPLDDGLPQYDTVPGRR